MATVTDDSLLWVEKDKDAIKDYGVTLTNRLVGTDVVTAATWAVLPAGLTIVSSSFTTNQVNVRVSGGTVNTWYALTVTYTTQAGLSDQLTLRVFIKTDAELVPSLGSALFPNRFTAVARLRNDQLMLAARNVLPQVTLSEDYIWEKLQAAESEIAHTLRVPLAPTQFFANPPTQAEIDALAGKPYGVDPAYDYGPEFFEGEKWGFIVTRQKPINSVSRIRFVYPAPTQGVFDVPLDWLRMDRKYGHIRFVPASSAFLAPMGAFLMQALGGGRTIPFAIEVTYVAGLENVGRDFPELVDVVKKLAVLKIVEDSLPPQSGSISADGLSQSMSVDMDKYRDTIDHVLNGPKGANGGLMTAIHGIRLSVLGA
jgi:hypothetical protein